MDTPREEIIRQVFIAAVSGAILWFVSSVRGDIREMTNSISNLNIQIHTLVERTSGYHKRVEEHEQRIRELESRRQGR
jgi:carbonic anhydrase/acetyltransferase-like protein (isoleucine patch superfamily)